MAPGYTRSKIETLLEKVSPDLKKQVLDQIELIDKDEILKNVLEAIQKDVMARMLKEKADDAKITMNQDLFIDSVISIINKTQESAEDQVNFLTELLNGKVIDCIKLVKDSLNKVVKMDSYVKTKSPLWSKVKDKLTNIDKDVVQTTYEIIKTETGSKDKDFVKFDSNTKQATSFTENGQFLNDQLKNLQIQIT